MGINQIIFSTSKKVSISMKTILVLTIMVGLFPEKAHSSQARVKIVPDTILIGQPSTLSIQVDVNQGELVILPDMTGSIYQNIEFWGMGIDTIPIDDERLEMVFILPFTSWTAGSYQFDPLPLTILQNGDTLKIESNPFSIEVLTIDIDEDADIYDIKPIKIMRASLKEILTYFIPIVLLLALIGWFLYRRFTKKNKPVPESIWDNEEIPAHIAAISSLERLRNKKLWQAGKIKQYHSELTFILRMFIEKRFAVNALEMTTSEICVELPKHIQLPQPVGQLEEVLRVADLVKFAKLQPLPNENEKSLEQAIEFVKANVPPKEENEDDDANSGNDKYD